MGSKAKKTREAKKVAQQKKAVKAKEKSEPPKSAKKAAAPEPKEMKTFSSKKRPATEMEPPASPPPYQPETSELEKKRLQVAEELRKVEQQIHDLESKYLEQSSAFGNAVRGYEGFLGGLSQANRKNVIKPEERLFSMSSSTVLQ